MSAMPIDNLENDDAPDAPRVRLLTLASLDGRTMAAKRSKALISELENDLGGADRLSAAERAIVHRAAIATAMLEDMEAGWLSGRSIDINSYCTLQNVQRRALTTLGLERRPRDVTPDLDRYIAARPPEPAPVSPLPVMTPPPLPVPR